MKLLSNSIFKVVAGCLLINDLRQVVGRDVELVRQLGKRELAIEVRAACRHYLLQLFQQLAQPAELVLHLEVAALFQLTAQDGLDRRPVARHDGQTQIGPKRF